MLGAITVYTDERNVLTDGFAVVLKSKHYSANTVVSIIKIGANWSR